MKGERANYEGIGGLRESNDGDYGVGDNVFVNGRVWVWNRGINPLLQVFEM